MDESYLNLLAADRFGPFPPGMVSLVGAGPGDPGLITLKGAARLARADVVLYDSLVNPALLRLARPDAELILTGKRGGQPGASQQQINHDLVAHARADKRVVRLKGGDPYVFGRGGEEGCVLAEAGIRFEVVPGVTAAVAGAAYAGVPLTHRTFGSTLALATGHEDSSKPESQIDFDALARMGTVVLYMGVRTLTENARKLTEAGMPPDTPVAVIRWGTRPEQLCVTGTLTDIAERVEQAGIAAPAVTVIGEVVSLRDRLNWFERLPLFGQRIVITRPAEQAGDLADHLAALGAEVLIAPAIEIKPLDDYAAVDEALHGIGHYAWLVLTSVNGVEALFARMDAAGLDGRALAAVRLATIGRPTADALARRFLHADVVPETYTSAGLAAAMARYVSLAGKRVLLLRADIASGQLPQALSQAGASCDDLPVYQTTKPAALPGDVVTHLRGGRVDWITFTSTSTVSNFFDLLASAACEELPNRVRLASIGPVTSEALRARGLEPAIEATPHTVPGLIEAIVSSTSSRQDKA
ncbi:MAG TPA: uroporphyrinogen-III C-methyltransferase [Phycisphaerae bacterium]|nr:uroporphyrinogen-III C-methyltransferase [Phycisphaerae bacterium]